MSSNGPLLLVADVGGTKTVLALAVVSPDGVRLQSATVRRVASAGYPHLRDLVNAYLDQTDAPRPRWACLGVPGPVMEGRCRTTNLPWDLEASELADSCGLEGVLLVNDVAALAWSLTAPPFPAVRILRANTPVPGAPKVVVALGTGLGSAAVVEGPGGPAVLATEAGHCDFVAVSREDRAIAEQLRQELGSVSYEHLVSGPGLARLYGYFAGPNLDPDFRDAHEPGAWVVAHAASDPRCDQAVRCCVGYLASFLGNLALVTLPLGGLFLTGSVAQGLAPWLSEVAFFQSFQGKSQHQELLAQVPFYLLQDPLAPLLGCAKAWSRQGQHLTPQQP